MKRILTLLAALAVCTGLAVIPSLAHAASPVPPGVSLYPGTPANTGVPATATRPRGYISSALGGGNLLYHGGPVQSTVHVHLIFWGLWWSSGCTGSQGNGSADESYLYNYWHGMESLGDGLSPVQTQYPDNAGGRPHYPSQGGFAFADWSAYCSDPPAVATDGQLAAVWQQRAYQHQPVPL